MTLDFTTGHVYSTNPFYSFTCYTLPLSPKKMFHIVSKLYAYRYFHKVQQTFNLENNYKCSICGILNPYHTTHNTVKIMSNINIQVQEKNATC